jgi:hypothetical protein
MAVTSGSESNLAGAAVLAESNSRRGCPSQWGAGKQIHALNTRYQVCNPEEFAQPEFFLF